jgi:lysozyme
MNINQRGLEIIRSFEGCKLESYYCPAKILTIGYGHTGQDVKSGMNITIAKANELLKKDLEFFEFGIERLVTSELNENQFSALVSFAFNCGLGNFKSSTLCKKVNANPSDATIKNEFMRWNKGGGQELAGLTRRRNVEAELYFSKV